MMYVDMRTIAHALGISKQAVHKRVKEAIEKGAQIETREQGQKILYKLEDLVKHEVLSQEEAEKVKELLNITPIDRLSKVVSKEDLEEFETEDFEELVSDVRVHMRLKLHPEVLILFSLAKKNGFEGDLSDFINACVLLYMAEHGYAVVVTQP